MTHPAFHPGEIAIVIDARPLTQYNGSECTIVGGLRPRPVAHPLSGFSIGRRIPSYQIEMPDGKLFLITPDGLRKRFDRGDWAALRDVWQPKTVTA